MPPEREWFKLASGGCEILTTDSGDSHPPLAIPRPLKLTQSRKMQVHYNPL